MCGICGVVSKSAQIEVSETLINQMRDTLVTRGPDDAGTLIFNDGNNQIGLGHRRLSILDLSEQGRQPMTTDDGQFTIVFNGEIFNYKELRSELEKTATILFKSNSDTEVLLYSIKEWGLEKTLIKLRGMYAFAIFDRKVKTLTLIRDPLGVKPLYYYSDEHTFAFASEIKAILALPWVNRKIDDSALWHYLTFANAPAPKSFFSGINKLEAGTYLVRQQSGSFKQVRYWDPNSFTSLETPKSESEYVEEIRRLLRQSVKRRMVSDVPFGVFLSGGVDSSLNVALMAEVMDRPVETFSVGIKDDPGNEFQYARQVAQHFKSNHHELEIDDNDFINFLPQMVHFQDEPLADPVCVPIYYISKLARDSGVTVIQVGEGSDEIFAGYEMYHYFNKANTRWYHRYKMLPRVLKKAVCKIAKGRTSSEYEDALRRAVNNEPLFLGNAIAFWDNEKNLLLKSSVQQTNSSALIKEFIDRRKVDDPLSRIIDLELHNRLPELLLMRVDKMSMANSIETRVPFLDEDLVAFALQIPSRLKYKNKEPKYILKKAAEGIIPNEIIYRKKHGFCGSATNMLRPKIYNYAFERIMESKITKNYFDAKYIESIFQKHKTQQRFNSMKIWNLMNLAIWYDYWFER